MLYVYIYTVFYVLLCVLYRYTVLHSERLYDMVYMLYVLCVFYVLTPPLSLHASPLLSLHAQVPNTLDVLSEEDFMMTQPRLVPSTYSSTRYTRYTQRALHGVYTPRNDPE